MLIFDASLSVVRFRIAIFSGFRKGVEVNCANGSVSVSQVLERSWEVVDNVNVSLRLWDTFGDHEKDRRFAYGRSDVVLLCFSVNNPVSLRNCRLMWYSEIRRFCPNTPVLLVGCKNDLRFMYRDEAYLSFFRDRSPFVRATRKSDLVMPDEARDVAQELGLYYYETSVLTYYGVNEVGVLYEFWDPYFQYLVKLLSADVLT